MTESRRTGLATFLIILSLLVHSFLMVMLILLKTTHQQSLQEPPIFFESFDDIQTTVQQEEPEPDQTIPAALKPRASIFGNPSTKPINEPELQEDVTKKMSLPSNESYPTQSVEKISTMQPDSSIPESFAPQPQEKKRKKKRHNATRYILDQSQLPSHDITFADIARGFIESVRNEGTDWLKRDGDPRKRPDPVEMRYLSYIQKVVWYLQNSFRQSELKNWPAQQATMSYIITVNKDGTIIKLQCTQSSGIVSLDEFMEKRIRNAAPFAPLPDHFKRNDFQIMLTLVVIHGIAPEIAGYIACPQR